MALMIYHGHTVTFLIYGTSRSRACPHGQRRHGRAPRQARCEEGNEAAGLRAGGPAARAEEARAGVIGRHVKIPGSFWEGRLTAAESKTQYKCAVAAFDALHTFDDGHKSAAFRLPRCGPSVIN